MHEEVYKEMTQKFQCPGCVCGSDTECGAYKLSSDCNSCDGHVLGTMVMGSGSFALGMPKGFCKPPRDLKDPNRRPVARMIIRFFESPEDHKSQWDRCNIPVWAMEQDGYLFIRVYMPRIDMGAVEVIKGGKLDMAPGALNVAEFIDEID